MGNEQGGILILGATNLPWALDSAIRRRFERRIYIDLPDMPARLFLLKSQLKATPHNLQKEDFEEIAKLTDGYTI